MDKHDENKLPLWAQERLKHERWRVKQLEEKMETLQDMNAVMVERRGWFTLRGPNFLDGESYRTLYVLGRNTATAVCTLGQGDVLFVGRAPTTAPAPQEEA